MAVGVARAAGVAVGSAPGSAGAACGSAGRRSPCPPRRFLPSPRLGRQLLPRRARRPHAQVAPATIPQFLGATRNGAVAGVRIADDWAARPPKQVWRRPIGAGWSGFAVAGGVAVTQEQRGNREMVVAYSLADGSPRWSHGDEAHYESTIAGEGPRATPTISRGRVFTLGSTGLLNCLDLETGKTIWRRDIAADNDSPPPDFGRSSSPLIVDDLVVVSAGGPSGRSLVAYQRESGEPAWRAGDDLASYSSPVVATLAGVRQIVVLNQSSVAGHDPATGRVLWNHPWPRTAPTVAIPLVVSENRVLLVRRVRRWQQAPADLARRRRRQPDARVGEHAAQGQVHEPGRFTTVSCTDSMTACWCAWILATGERRWKSGRYGHGQTLLVGNRLIVQTEDGEIVLVEASPEAHREIARFTAFQQKTWNPPALAGRYLAAAHRYRSGVLRVGGGVDGLRALGSGSRLQAKTFDHILEDPA